MIKNVERILFHNFVWNFIQSGGKLWEQLIDDFSCIYFTVLKFHNQVLLAQFWFRFMFPNQISSDGVCYIFFNMLNFFSIGEFPDLFSLVCGSYFYCERFRVFSLKMSSLSNMIGLVEE